MTVINDLKIQFDDLWRSAIHHEFIEQVDKRTLPIDKFRRYFMQDFVFIKDLVKTSSIAISKAQNLADARELSKFLNGILSAEGDLFEEIFDFLEITRRDYLNIEALPTTAAFGNFLIRLAYERSFEEICCALFVTEAVYMDWGERLKNASKGPVINGTQLEDFYKGWIELHGKDVLGNFVKSMEQIVNSVPRNRYSDLAEVFERTLKYEIAFWDMSYSGENWI